MVVNGLGKFQLAGITVIDCTVHTGLLIQDADAAVDIRIGRAFAIEKVIVGVFGKIHFTRLIETACVIGHQCACHFEVFRGGQRVLPGRCAGLKKEAIVTGFMMVGDDMR